MGATRQGLAAAAVLASVVVAACGDDGGRPQAARAASAARTTPTARAVPQAPAPPALSPDDSVKVDARRTTLRFTTPTLGDRPVHVEVLLPTGYDADSSRRWPVVYLLHGSNGLAKDFLDMGQIEDPTSGVPAILVMPDGGFGKGGGWYADWDNGGHGGAPEWETFDIRQLIPWVDANYRTIASRRGRAIAGVSMGGFGAMSLAARNPELFTSAASFSGAVAIAGSPAAIAVSTPDIEGDASDEGSATAIFGPRDAAHALNWAGHDPVTLGGNLRGTDVELWTGNGKAGPLDDNPPADVEPRIRRQTHLLADRLRALRVRYRLDDYGNGTHSWGYWRRDLLQYLPRVLSRFAHPPARPSRISYRSTAPSFSQWGWQVARSADTLALTTLSGATRRGFELSGAGAAMVTTPASFRAGSAHHVDVRVGARTRTARVTAGGDGRLRIAIPDGRGSATVRIG